MAFIRVFDKRYTDMLESKVSGMNTWKPIVSDDYQTGETWLTMRSTEVPATYGCIFGKSHKIEGLDKATLDFRVNRGSSTLIGTGPPDRTFWLFYKELDTAYHGAEIPRFGNEDLAKVVNEHSNEMILPGVPLSKLYESRIEAFYSPTREFVYSKWHLDRMLIIGDAAHQV